MKKQRIPIGEKFGRLRVLGDGGRAPDRHTLWRCRCECGRIVVVLSNNVKAGSSASCGCLHNELTARRAKTHGGSRTDLYGIWCGMIQRCTNPARGKWSRYGGRGIKVCARWRNSFEAFSVDVGPRPSRQHTIDRKNNDGDYEPGNVRWATAKEQAANRKQRSSPRRGSRGRFTK